MKSFLVAVLLSIAATALAQDEALEFMRQDLNTQKVAIMTASLPLTEKEADLFWPIYREYNFELSKLGDRRVAVIKKYAANYEKIDEKMADELVKESFSIAKERNGLLEKYYKQVAKAVGAVAAARFLQVENQILTLVDAQITTQMPLVKATKVSEEKK